MIFFFVEFTQITRTTEVVRGEREEEGAGSIPEMMWFIVFFCYRREHTIRLRVVVRILNHFRQLLNHQLDSNGKSSKWAVELGNNFWF